ncbi:unnamed protein product [Gulo gulo]|uniref:Uncharacterized protein n=1 Tax=Gulo gulo TaxID=48420 RepID=A0A9X9LH85_GULGU|nr:unnamed protein product [Gulo gulo]
MCPCERLPVPHPARYLSPAGPAWPTGPWRVFCFLFFFLQRQSLESDG